MARLPYGEGVFRRRVLLRARGEGRVISDLEDDFHRFRVRLAHDGRHVVDLRGEAHRHPWTACPGATRPLEALRGMALSTRITAAGHRTDPRLNCTHLFDAASLAVTHAAAGRSERDYEIAVPDYRGTRTQATLHRDGSLLLDWPIEDHRIQRPHEHAGVKLLGSGFVRWLETLPEELAEAAYVLRRAVYIAAGRSYDMDEARDATYYMSLTKGSCYAFQEGVAQRALRVRESDREFTRHPERLLADLRERDAASGDGSASGPRVGPGSRA